ncbi:MAG: CpsB/CapC family capsule biosynthesis tyrosine phosphatase [Myxococcota bacterium]
MIDLHCHLVWGVDDGCRTADDALQMARALVDAGVTAVACTPHLRHDKGWVNTRPVVTEKLPLLKEKLSEAGIPLQLHEGSEHYLTPELFEHVSRGEHTPYALGSYMLTEIPYSGPPPDLPGVLYRLRRAGLQPLLAHVERYSKVGVDLRVLTTLHEQGYALQVNLGSLVGAYGRDNEKAALKILDAGLCHVVAGDCHGPEDPAALVQKGLKVLQKKWGRATAELLAVHNPRAVLEGRPVQDMAS